jgi:hypothetical protein
MSDPFALLSPIELSSDPFDLWSWSSTGALVIENPNTLSELDNGCHTLALPSAVENAVDEHTSLSILNEDLPQTLITLGNPVLHNSLFGKFESLLNMCKNMVRIMCQLSLTQTARRSRLLCHAAKRRHP